MNEKVAKKATREEVAQRILVGCAVLGGLIGGGFSIANELHLDVPMPVIGAVLIGTLALVLPLSVVYWRMIDEAAREAHKFAWFWGGQGGMIVALALGACGDSAKLTAAFGELSPAGWLFIGMLALLVAQIIGYGLTWAGWWLVRRR